MGAIFLNQLLCALLIMYRVCRDKVVKELKILGPRRRLEW